MDPLRLSLALGPLAIYLLLLGMLNLSRRPWLVTGGRDAFALGLAVSGLVIVGPMELFFPVMAANDYGPFVWGLLVALYLMSLVLLLLMLRPRLVIYNISLEELRPILAQLMVEMDPEARWAGESAAMPNLGVQLRMEPVASMRNVSLLANGPRQEPAGWRRLEQELGVALRQVEVARNPRAVSLILTAMLLIGLMAYAVTRDPQSVAHALFDMVQLNGS
jgi:hypothetical protein